MPSKLPVIKANTTPQNIEKMRVIASANKRSIAKELEWLIERHIAEYESIHGEIDATFSFEKFVEMANDKNLSKEEKRRLAVQMGKQYVDQEGEKLLAEINENK